MYCNFLNINTIKYYILYLPYLFIYIFIILYAMTQYRLLTYIYVNYQ